MGKSFLEIKGGDIEGQIAFNKKQSPEITPKLEEDASEGGTNLILFCLSYSTTDGRFNLKEHQRMFGEGIYQHLEDNQRALNSRGLLFSTLSLEVIEFPIPCPPLPLTTKIVYVFDAENPEGLGAKEGA